MTRFAQRFARPYAVVLAVATGIIAVAVLSGAAVGSALSRTAAWTIGVAAVAAVAALAGGVAARSHGWILRGLLASTGVWVVVGVASWGALGWGSTFAALCWCWAALSGWAWLIERRVPRE